MTGAVADEEADGESIDPSWWLPAMVDENDASCDFRNPIMISMNLAKLRSEAEAAVGEGILRTRVLGVLCRATSAMLVADNWGEPFAPAMQFGNERTVVPSDLSASELELLGRLVPLIDEPTLKARVADVVWTYGDRSNMGMLTAAVDSYRSLPLNADCWNDIGRDSWRRAIELSLRRGTQGRTATSEMAADLLEVLLASDGSAGYMAIGVSGLLGDTRAVEKAEARDLADLLASVAASLAGDHRLKRVYEREAATWYGRVRETDLVNACVERVVQAYLDKQTTGWHETTVPSWPARSLRRPLTGPHGSGPSLVRVRCPIMGWEDRSRDGYATPAHAGAGHPQAARGREADR